MFKLDDKINTIFDFIKELNFFKYKSEKNANLEPKNNLLKDETDKIYNFMEALDDKADIFNTINKNTVRNDFYNKTANEYEKSDIKNIFNKTLNYFNKSFPENYKKDENSGLSGSYLSEAKNRINEINRVSSLNFEDILKIQPQHPPDFGRDVEKADKTEADTNGKEQTAQNLKSSQSNTFNINVNLQNEKLDIDLIGRLIAQEIQEASKNRTIADYY